MKKERERDFSDDYIIKNETPAIFRVIKDKMDVMGNYINVKKEYYSLLRYYTGRMPTDFPSYIIDEINYEILKFCEPKNVKYHIYFDTENYIVRRNQKNWEIRLMDDTILKLNKIGWNYKTIAGLENRFSEIQGHGTDLKPDYFTLTDTTLNGYGKQMVKKALPGICSGYISWSSVWDKLEMDFTGIIKIPFTHFYDIRALNNINLKKCFVVIEKTIE